MGYVFDAMNKADSTGRPPEPGDEQARPPDEQTPDQQVPDEQTPADAGFEAEDVQPVEAASDDQTFESIEDMSEDVQSPAPDNADEARSVSIQSQAASDQEPVPVAVADEGADDATNDAAEEISQISGDMLSVDDAVEQPEPTCATEPTVADSSGGPSAVADLDYTPAQDDADNDAAEEESPALCLHSDQAVSGIDDRLVPLTDPSSMMVEQYRGIRTRLLARWQHQRHLAHTITSATPKEGKTLTSLNLGAVFGELPDRRTVVLEGDLRVPAFADMLNLDEGPGMIQLARGVATVDEVLTPTPQPNLFVIQAGGKAADDAIQMLSSPQMAEAIMVLKERFDHVLIDTPPVLELADAGILGAMSDDVLLVVRMNRTPQPLVDQAMRALQSYNAPVAGIVLTDLKMHGGGYGGRYGYRYRYHYRYQQRGRRIRRSA